MARYHVDLCGPHPVSSKPESVGPVCTLDTETLSCVSTLFCPASSHQVGRKASLAFPRSPCSFIVTFWIQTPLKNPLETSPDGAFCTIPVISDSLPKHDNPREASLL